MAATQRALGNRCVRLIVATSALLLLSTASNAEAPRSPSIGGELLADFKYFVDNVQLDLQDIVTSPLYIASENSVFRSPRFYLTLAGVGALWGGSYALDQTLRSHLHNMSSADADLLQNISYGSVCGGTALLYAYGLYSDDAQTRQDVLTGAEGAGVATLLTIGIKAAFGRLRPFQDNHSHTAWFRGGSSFVSGDVTPLFGLAAGISEAFHNEWYVAAPAYSLALLDGFGRMGHDKHWFSDVVGAGLLGWGTAELFFYLHRQHANQPSRWRIFPLEVAPSAVGRRNEVPPLGFAVAYDW